MRVPDVPPAIEEERRKSRANLALDSDYQEGKRPWRVPVLADVGSDARRESEEGEREGRLPHRRREASAKVRDGGGEDGGEDVLEGRGGI